MSEPKFTPGPWQLETVRTQIGVCHKVGALGSSTKIRNACLYDDCYSAEPCDLQLLADAHLISAAPDLYDSLAKLFQYIDDGLLVRSTRNDSDPAWTIRMLNFVIDLKRGIDALAKARGEASSTAGRQL